MSRPDLVIERSFCKVIITVDVFSSHPLTLAMSLRLTVNDLYELQRYPTVRNAIIDAQQEMAIKNIAEQMADMKRERK